MEIQCTIETSQWNQAQRIWVLFNDEVDYIELEVDDEIVAKVPRKKVPVSTKKNLSKKEISDCLDTLKFMYLF